MYKNVLKYSISRVSKFGFLLDAMEKNLDFHRTITNINAIRIVLTLSTDIKYKSIDFKC